MSLSVALPALRARLGCLGMPGPAGGSTCGNFLGCMHLARLMLRHQFTFEATSLHGAEIIVAARRDSVHAKLSGSSPNCRDRRAALCFCKGNCCKKGIVCAEGCCVFVRPWRFALVLGWYKFGAGTTVPGNVVDVRCRVIQL